MTKNDLLWCISTILFYYFYLLLILLYMLFINMRCFDKHTVANPIYKHKWYLIDLFHSAFSKTRMYTVLKSLISIFVFTMNIEACSSHETLSRGGSRTAATSKMEHFVIIVNGFQPLIIITKNSILDVATVLDPPLLSKHLWIFISSCRWQQWHKKVILSVF